MSGKTRLTKSLATLIIGVLMVAGVGVVLADSYLLPPVSTSTVTVETPVKTTTTTFTAPGPTVTETKTPIITLTTTTIASGTLTAVTTVLGTETSTVTATATSTEYVPLEMWFTATTDASTAYCPVPGTESTNPGYCGVSIESPTPIVDTPVTETLNDPTTGAVTLAIAADSRNTYYDAGVGYNIGTLGTLASQSLTITGSNFDINLEINPQLLTKVPYPCTLCDYISGYSGPTEGSTTSAWALGTCGGAYPTGNCAVPASDTIGPSSTQVFLFSSGVCGHAAGSYTFSEVAGYCGSTTPFGIWVGLDTGSSGGTATVTSMYLS